MPVLGAARVVTMMSQHFKALGPHLYMFQLHSAFEQAPSELRLYEKRLRNVIQNNADTMGLTPCLGRLFRSNPASYGPQLT